MNWDAIGAIAETLGAVAVVVTILYLARETRRGAQAINATSARDAAQQISEWHREVARDPELKRILLKSVSTEVEEYSGEEWFEFRLLAISLFTIYQIHFVHQSLDIGSSELARINIRYAQSLIKSFPAWRKFWDAEVAVDTFMNGFVEAVNESEIADYAYLSPEKNIVQEDT